MKKMLLALAMMSVMTFADVHPALKEAIDSKNYKQAENLIKNVGVKDVYCPATLSAKDADKVYGKVFAGSITLLLDNCDMDFSRNYLEYKCAGGKNKDMCLSLLSSTDPNSWPETYAKQFCTKKNVEICAAAVERIPVEKSVPYLKAIKANKLANMKEKMEEKLSKKDECVILCNLTKAMELSGDIIDSDILKAKQDARRATTMSQVEYFEQKILRLEHKKKDMRSKDYCERQCFGIANKPEVEDPHYYLGKAFYSLSQQVMFYYSKLTNPIIPGLAENWSVVDNFIETTKESEYGKKISPYTSKSMILDTLKSIFAENGKIGVSKKLFYCKIYPSLEKETEKLFGTNILNCKLLLGRVHKEKFVDSRDGRVYSKIKIKNQVWMAENLNYAGSSATESLKDKLWCYDNLEDNCITYGRLYTWAAAQEVCPDGWHLPSKAEWETLFTSVGGKNDAGEMLKSSNGWSNDGNGVDPCGFSALPAGYRRSGGDFDDADSGAGFWSSSEYGSDDAYYVGLDYGDEDAYLGYGIKYFAFSVRCLQNN